MCYTEGEKLKQVETEDTREKATDRGRSLRKEETGSMSHQSLCRLFEVTEYAIYTSSPNVQLYTYIVSGTYLELLF